MARPKEFVPDEALDRAVKLFWRKGYESTSTRELMQTMGLSRQSMYDTFGDKHSLFLKALDRYSQQFKDSPLLASDASLQAIRGHFQMTLDKVISEPALKSCMMANTALELAIRDREVAGKIRQWLKRIETKMHKALVSAVRKGELRDGGNLRALSRYLTGAVHGLGILARGGTSIEELKEVVEITLSVLQNQSAAE